MRHRFPWIDSVVLDRVVALGLAVDLVLESLLASGLPDRVVTAFFAVPFAAAVALRRAHPAAALLGCVGVGLLEDPFHGQLYNLPSSSAVLVLMLTAYGAGAWLGLRRSALTIGAAIGGLLVDQTIEFDVTGVSGGGVSGALTLAALVVMAWAFGRFAGARARRADAFSALAVQVAEERDVRERTAIALERITIGRELQDIIAHSVSVMVVQAGGARRLLRTDPDRARESIRNVEQTGRDALAEMRTLLGLLRKEDDPRALTPQPGLDQLPHLADSLRESGLSCELRTEGTPVELTPGINLAGYRVVEAALTLAQHSGCRRGDALLRYRPRHLELTVVGDRPLRDAAATLRSVIERVELYGGRLDIGDDGVSPAVITCVLPIGLVPA